ncbi:hypothetical protein IQ03_05141 [Gemmobacter caeni]|uniref:Uncharacterized protein n=1 Tax=Gemmobacter caeni TaxID=589035 RepID=A0A2T6A7D7_9RHOB|nr:hypothetical protein [Gemmobacter caeni]PTX39741.1 hypothetical protein C8N34_1373 [Gemmobacter caeni]TWI89854.1 hypothetical protein IQ03_05141 [Gemmobacter caeni]
MTSSEWTYQPSGLGLRSDEFSIQGSCRDDPRFFLRRDRYKLNALTDLNLGDISDENVVRFLAEFLAKSGGITGGKFEVVDIARRTDDHGLVTVIYDRTTKVLKQVMMEMGFSVKNAYLDDKMGRYNSVLVLEENIEQDCR